MAAADTARENPVATRAAAAAISSSVEILQSHLEFVLDERVGALSGDQRRFLDVAARHGRLLARLSEDLETLVLAEGGILVPEWAPCELGELAEQALREVRPLAAIARKPIQLLAAEPVWIVGDGRQLGRATVELLELALRCGARERAIEVVIAPLALELVYEGECPPEGSLALCLARAVVGAHGGAFSCVDDGGLVHLTLSLVAE